MLTFIEAKKPNGQTMFINIDLIKAFKPNPMNEDQCIIYIDAEAINMNAFGPQAEEDDVNDYASNVFYVDKDTLISAVYILDLDDEKDKDEDEEIKDEDEEIGEPITDSSEFEDPNEDAEVDDEEIGEPLTDSDEFEDPNEE